MHGSHGSQSLVATATPAQVSAAREALDAWVREVVAWHFDPATGSPFWLDYAEKLGWDPRREVHGFDKRAAIVAAAKIRLRPILMTTAAMALAVVPLITAEGAGAAARYSMGIVIFTGLLIGTMFTLFVVPMFYTVISPATHAATHDELAHPTPAE